MWAPPPPPPEPSASTSATDYRATMPFCIASASFASRGHIWHFPPRKCTQTQRRQTFLLGLKVFFFFPPYLQVGDSLRHVFAISGSHPVGWAPRCNYYKNQRNHHGRIREACEKKRLVLRVLTAGPPQLRHDVTGDTSGNYLVAPSPNRPEGLLCFCPAPKR